MKQIYEPGPIVTRKRIVVFRLSPLCSEQNGIVEGVLREMGLMMYDDDDDDDHDKLGATPVKSDDDTSVDSVGGYVHFTQPHVSILIMTPTYPLLPTPRILVRFAHTKSRALCSLRYLAAE